MGELEAVAADERKENAPRLLLARALHHRGQDLVRLRREDFRFLKGVLRESAGVYHRVHDGRRSSTHDALADVADRLERSLPQVGVVGAAREFEKLTDQAGPHAGGELDGGNRSDDLP